jgi:N-acetylglucosaminyldiphosphoundecaprenol N-acetyl-beta-D-mannosaminyltransferase
LDNLDQLEVSCIGTSGALMEVIAGKLSIPPRWMGTLGIEWLYRLWKTPRRVAHRYLVEPWLLAWLILRNQVRTYIASRRCQ